MPRGFGRTEPIGLWRVGASAAERVQAARAWAARLFQGAVQLPPFHGENSVAVGRPS